MLTSRNQQSLAGPAAGIAVVLLGLFMAIVTAYLLVNPAGLPNILYAPYFARLVPLVFLGAMALIMPLVTLLLAFLAMFGGEALVQQAKALFPISPFWTLLAVTAGAQFARNIHRNRAVPWAEGLILILLILWTVLYDVVAPTPGGRGITVGLLAGLALMMSLGMLRTWRQIGFVVFILCLAFVFLLFQLLPYLTTSWGSFGGTFRTTFGGLSSSLRQAVSLDWLFNAMALLCLGVAVRTRGRTRLLMSSLFIAFATSSILTFSRGAFVGLGVGMLALFLLERKATTGRIGWFLIAALVVGAIAYYSGAWTYSFQYRGVNMELQRFREGEPGRLSVYLEGIKQLPAHWLIGEGSVGSPAHSTFLDIWNDYGGVYAVAFFAFLLFLFRRSYLMARGSSAAISNPGGRGIALGLYCSFAGVLVQMMVDPMLFTLSFSAVFWAMRGLEIAIWRSGLAVPTRPQTLSPGPSPDVVVSHNPSSA